MRLSGGVLLVTLILAASKSWACPGGDCIGGDPTWVELDLNGQALGYALVRRFSQRTGLWLESSAVQAQRQLSDLVGVVRMSDDVSWSSLESMTPLTYSLEGERLRLQLPVQAFDAQSLSAGPTPQSIPPQRGQGWVLHYDSNVNWQDFGQGQSTASTLLDLQRFHPLGVFRHQQLLQFAEQSQTTRLQSQWVQELWSKQSLLTVGDHLSAADAFGRQYQLGGVQLRRALEFTPLRLTFPIPVLEGRAELPSTVDLIIDGVRQRQYQVQPGPFVIRDAPPLSGSGQAQLRLRNALGEEVLLNRDLVIFPQLLRAGLLDYSLSLGALRQDVLQQSFAYSGRLFAASARYAWSNTLNLSATVHARENDHNWNTGLLMRLPVLPVLAQAGWGGFNEDDQRGDLINWGLNMQYRSVRASWLQEQLRLREPGQAELPYRRQQRGQLSWRRGLWNVGASWLQREFVNQPRFRRLGLRTAWTLPGAAGQMLFEVFATQDGDAASDVGGRLQWIWSPRAHRFVSSFVQDDGQASVLWQQQRPSELGLNWGAQAQRDSQGDATVAVQADLNSSRWSWRGGWRETAGGRNVNMGLRGSVAWVGQRPVMGRNLGQAFAVVDLGGLSEVLVYRDNQPVARSDRRGLALVANLRPYEPNRIHIDAAAIPLDRSLAASTQTLRPARTAGLLVDFAPAQLRSLLFKVVYKPGAVVAPAGAEVWLDGVRQPAGYLGSAGQAYAELPAGWQGGAQLRWPQGECELVWPPLPATKPDHNLGDVLCR
nr:fimbrial biogenesis outer membrane usher protein [Oceanococcus sp. HetDA_MAG_MS8]